MANIQFKGGRLPNDPTKRRITLYTVPEATYTPPPTLDYYSVVPKSSWGMDGNDNWGDCTLAEIDHAEKSNQVVAGNTEVVSTTKEVLAAYSAVTGFDPNDPSTDQGAVMQDVRNYWRKNGVTLGGKPRKILLFAELNNPTKNINLVKLAVEQFGEVGLGINFPDSAMDQFDQGEPWDVVAGATIEGGHAIALVGFDEEYFYIVTWGEVHKMTLAFFTKYVDEAWIQINEDFVNAKSGSTALGQTLYQLGQQFQAVTGQTNPVPIPDNPPVDPTPTPTPPTPEPVHVPFLMRFLQFLKRLLGL